MNLINRYTDKKFIRVTSYAIIIGSLLLLLITLLRSNNSPTVLGTDKGYDYSALYIAGKILNEYGAKELYNYNLQNTLYRELRPYLQENSSLPNPYPPFFNSIFIPLALLPFSYSYGVWLVISAFLYLLGIKLILSQTSSFNVRDKHTIFLLAISFEPFIMECWIGGQTSSFGFFFISLAIYYFKIKKPFISGISFGLCLYKPTLLLLILPFFLITRQYRVCLGILSASVILVVYTVLLLGLDSLANWFNFAFQHFNSASGPNELLRIYKFVDIVSCTRMVFGSLETIERILVISIFICWVVYIFIVLKILKINDDFRKELALASIIVWSTVINIYFPIYDTIVVVLSLILIVDKQNTLVKDDRKILDSRTRLILMSIYIAPWITFIFAQKLKIQLFTLVLIAVGIFIGRLYKQGNNRVSIGNPK